MEPLIMLHGAIGSRAQLEELERLLSHRYEVHRLNFPGHGGEPLPEQFSIPYFAEAVWEYCIEKGLTKVSLFGYSMGGYVALYLAKHQPELVQRVATLGTKFHWDETIAAKECKMLVPETIQQKVPQFAQALDERHHPQDWKAVLQKTAAMLTGMGHENVLKPEDYTTISTPSLLMLGDRDKMVTLQETVAVYQHLPNAQLAVLPNMPHTIETVAVERLAWMLQQFIP